MKTKKNSNKEFQLSEREFLGNMHWRGSQVYMLSQYTFSFNSVKLFRYKFPVIVIVKIFYQET